MDQSLKPVEHPLGLVKHPLKPGGSYGMGSRPTVIEGVGVCDNSRMPRELSYLATDTRTPYMAAFDGDDGGKIAYYMLRWGNHSRRARAVEPNRRGDDHRVEKKSEPCYPF